MRCSYAVLIAVFSVLLYSGCVQAGPPVYTFEQGMDVQVDGVTWLRTLITPYDARFPERYYKVYTHLYDFEGALPVTKGIGGKYPHHRGLFIGWRKTYIGERLVNSWSRSDSGKETSSSQQWVEWTNLSADAHGALQAARIQWFVDGEDPFMEEERTLRAFSLGDRLRAVDFRSTFTTLGETVLLQGDPQHAGMHVRMAQEVADQESETCFVLPKQARVLDNDVVEGAWWICASMPVRGVRYWVMHMTSPRLPAGVPLYSIRKYGRFGAFFESEVTELKPLETAFRIVYSDEPLEQDHCEALYQAFAQEEMKDIR